MSAPALELQKAVFAALSGDAELSAALGGARIFDHVPANTPFPYVTFGRTSVYDWSTGTESGTEQLFTVHAWSKGKGKAEALAIIDLVRARLDDQPLALDAGTLVSMRLEYSEVRFDDDLSVYHGIARFRALVDAAA